MSARLQVMKFGGTSVGDAGCMARTAQIIAQGAREGACVAVVSAMSGVTNRLIEAAKRAGAGESGQGAAVLSALRTQHEQALSILVRDETARNAIREELEEVFGEGSRLFEGTALLRELTPRTLDAISSLGERLSAPLVAGAVRELGLQSEAVDATEVIITDAFHGGAEPLMDRTREECEVRLRPMIEKGIVAVVTGFLGATTEGKLTTLGRGGSDYSATILGAALGADEVIIWTDVDGVLTADPRLVPEARTIPVISYREAAELAFFGAKVLHARRPQHRRRRESADRDSGRGADQRGRAGDCGIAGRCGQDVFDDGGSARECAADFAVVITKRYLLHCVGSGCAADGRSAAQRVCARFGAREGGAHHDRFQYRHCCSGRREHARNARSCGAHVQRIGP
jgi:aspartate kinase